MKNIFALMLLFSFFSVSLTACSLTEKSPLFPNRAQDGANGYHGLNGQNGQNGQNGGNGGSSDWGRGGNGGDGGDAE